MSEMPKSSLNQSPRLPKRTNADLFNDAETFRAALASFNSNVRKGSVDECWLWLGSSCKQERFDGTTRKLGIFKFGRFAAMNMQRFAFIAEHRLNDQTVASGSRAVVSITSTCGSEMCANPNHIVERAKSTRASIEYFDKAISPIKKRIEKNLGRQSSNTLTLEEISGLRIECAHLADGPDYRIRDYVLNLNNTALDFQMRAELVDTATSYFTRTHHIKSHSELRSIVDQFPNTRSGNQQLAKFLWNYNFWSRAKFLRRLLSCFEERGISDQKSLERWVKDADFEADVKGRFKTEEHSIGYALFHWLRLRCGVDTVKPDVHIINFVSESVGRRVSPTEAVQGLTTVARELGREAFRLDAAIWHHQRGRPTLERKEVTN